MAKVPIYFSGSISGGREDAGWYRAIIERLVESGHRVYADHVGDEKITGAGEVGEPNAIFDRDMQWIGEVGKMGGVLVAEVSRQSIGVGYEIAAARYHFRMPVVAIFRPKYVQRCSAMIAGDSAIHLVEAGADATLAELAEPLLEAIAAAVNKSQDRPV